MWTIMIALVLCVTFGRTVSIDMFHVSASTSTSTGVAPVRKTANKQEAIVNDGRMTSSSTPKSIACKTRSKATLPFATAMPCFLPISEANFFSNSPTIGESPERKLLSRQASTAALSSTVICG